MAEPKSIREMADAEPAETELFPMGSLEGDEKTLGQLIRPNQSTEVTVAMTKGEVPSPTGGLLDPNKTALVLVTCEVGQYAEIPIREGTRADGDRKITGWKLRQQLTPIYVEKMAATGGVIEASFAALLQEDEPAAAALLDRMQARVEQALGVTA